METFFRLLILIYCGEKNRRMCSEIFFDRYFKFSLSDEEISQNDIKLILASGNNYEKLFFKITELNASNLTSAFLSA